MICVILKLQCNGFDDTITENDRVQPARPRKKTRPMQGYPRAINGIIARGPYADTRESLARIQPPGRFDRL